MSTGADYLREEARLCGSAYDELPLLSLADDVTDALLAVLRQAAFDPPNEDPPSAAYCRHQALFYIGLLTLRALRCESLLIRSGYEPEALVFKRVLSEASGRAVKVAEDSSGEYARAWLRGEGGGAGKVLRQLPGNLAAGYSSTAHVGYKAVEAFMATDGEGQTSFMVQPRRHLPELSYENLCLSAADGLQVAALLAKECSVEVPNNAALLERTITAVQDRPGLG